MRPVTSEDLYKFQWPSNPTLSPNGKQVVYEKTIARETTNDYETHLWLSDVDGKSERVLTTLGTRNVNAVWAPDGQTMAYLSNQSWGTQLWMYSLGDDEARMVTRFSRSIGSIVFAPDGKSIYATVPVKRQGHVEVLEADQSASEAEQQIAGDHIAWKNSPKRMNELHYKLDGAGLQKEMYMTVVAIDIDSCSYEQLIGENYNILEYAVSPDGKQIAFAAITTKDANPLFAGELYTVPMTGGDAKLLYSSFPVSSPSYSPDGKWISFISGDVIHRQLFAISSEGGEVNCLSEQYPDTLADLSYTDMRYIRTPAKPQWSKDNQFIYALSTYQGTNEIVRFSLAMDCSPTTVVGGKRTIFHFSYDGENTIVAAYSSGNHPGKVATIHFSEADYVVRKLRKPTDELPVLAEIFPSEEVRLDTCNEELLAEIIVVEPEAFSYSSVDGWGIQGFLLKPANRTPGEKYPVFLDIHGGPHSMHGFTYFHQMQLLSAQGFAVMYTNPRGSSGFGKEFTKSVQGDYGGKDMHDILNGVDEVSKRYDFIDSTKVAVNGLSYGGFMTNWLITHTDRFFAAVSEGCISNWVSMYGTSDVCPGFMDNEFVGQTDMETLWKLSPLAYVDDVQTPLLIMHAEEDLRCPIEQAEQFYSHIKRQGKEVEFLRFPNSSHSMLQNGEPKNRIARVDAIVQWVSDHLEQ